jgi:mannose-6-phosphate isomerase-like protein (cupin superfamily)
MIRQSKKERHQMGNLTRFDPSAFDHESFSRQVLVGLDEGISSLHMYAALVPAGKAGPGLHTHAFDQFFFVLQGRLTVEINGQRSVALPNTLVTIPRGAPHRQWNEGPEDELHLAILAPHPEPGQRWDTPV